MTEIEKRHFKDLEDQLIKWDFKDSQEWLSLSHDFYWSRPEEGKEEEILHTNILYYDKQGKFFILEMTNEHGHYACNPITSIKSIVDVLDFWKSITGIHLKLTFTEHK